MACAGNEAVSDQPDGDQESTDNQTPCQFDTQCGVGEKCDNKVCIPDPDYTDGDPTSDGDDIITDGDCTGPIIETPDMIDFGAFLMNSPVTKQLQISNTGCASLTIRTIEFALTNSEFEVDYVAGTAVTLAPGLSMTVSITYEPKLPQEANMPLLIASDAVNEPLRTVLLQSEYKGTSDFTFEPEALNFGNVTVDDPGLDMDLMICNDGEGNKAITITGLGFKYPSTVPHFRYSMNPEPSSVAPVFLNVGTCMSIMLTYEPTEATIWPQLHENFIVFYNDADNAVNGQVEIPMSGSADQFSLRVEPNPIDFGEVVIGETAASTLQIENQSGAEMEVTRISLSGNHCFEFDLVLGDYNPPFTLTADTLITDMGVSYSPQNTGQDQGCFFMMEYEQSGHTRWAQTSVIGSGRLENIPPIAKISRTDSGADISQPIDIPAGASTAQKRITLYGDISSDPDQGYPLTYAWTLTKPDESNTEVWPDPSEPIITFTVDWSGPYTLTLVVTDKEGAVSEPKDVLVNVMSNEKVTVDMEFSGDGTMNVNLVWRSPSGLTCSDETMNSQRSCMMGLDGTAFVSNYTNQYDNGNKETIVHPNAPDGAYVIKVAFTEDCAGWDIGFICLDRGTTDITVKIYVDMENTPSYTVREHLSEEGQVKEWFINKVGGVWGQPQ